MLVHFDGSWVGNNVFFFISLTNAYNMKTVMDQIVEIDVSSIEDIKIMYKPINFACLTDFPYLI